MHLPPKEALRQLALDAAADVDLARDQEQAARLDERDPTDVWVTWDRAAASFRMLALYCEQHRDELPPEWRPSQASRRDRGGPKLDR